MDFFGISNGLQLDKIIFGLTLVPIFLFHYHVLNLMIIKF